MTTLEGTVKAIKDGTMKNGNPYQRLCVVDAAGGDHWMPCFNGKMASVGDRIIAEIKEGQYSEQYGQSYIIEDYVLQGGQAPQQATKSSPESSSQGDNGNPDVWRVKDLNIAAQAAFKAICVAGSQFDSEADLKNAAKIAMDISIYWDKRARACVNGADINELKRNLADDVAEKVNTEGVLPGSTGAFEPGVPPNEGQVQDLDNQALNGDFDDDLPF